MPGNGMMPVGRPMLLCSGVNECPNGFTSGCGCRFGSGSGVVDVTGRAGVVSAGELGSIKARKRSIAACCSGLGFGAAGGTVKALVHGEISR